jgi:dsDNA-specific endonuclease/ATPase MutS2
MDDNNVSKSLHARSQIVHDAIKDVVHDAACRTHASKRAERIEEQLRQVSDEVTNMVRHIKESKS